MFETVELLEDIIINRKAKSASEAVSKALNSTSEWLSLKDKTELYRIAKIQYRNPDLLKLFKEEN